ESPEVVQLIGARISDGQTLNDSKVGLGDKILAATTSTAAAAGSADGLILAAPVAVVDAETRDNYAGQVSGLTGPVGTR
ncbi:esterase, partial [Rhizobium leguminosarum]